MPVVCRKSSLRWLPAGTCSGCAGTATTHRERNSLGLAAKPLASMDASGFAANPKLFRSRWVVAVPAQPLQVPAGSHLKLDFLHTTGIDFRRAPLRRIRLYASADPRWSAPATQQTLTAQLNELVKLEQRLKQVPSIAQPVMAEQASFEQRHTLEFE